MKRRARDYRDDEGCSAARKVAYCAAGVFAAVTVGALVGVCTAELVYRWEART